MACGIFPTYRCSPPTDSGATTTCSAFPILRMAARRARARRLTGPARAELRLPPRSMAGIQALVNQKMGGAQGNPNPVYYKLAASSVASSVFHSITTGDIAVNCSGDINCFGNGFVGRGRATPVTEFDGNGGAIDHQPNLYAGLCRRQRLELRHRAGQRGCLQPDPELEQRPVRMTPMYKTNFPS